MTWAGFAMQLALFALALLFAYGGQPIPGGGIRAALWWHRIRGLTRKRTP